VVTTYPELTYIRVSTVEEAIRELGARGPAARLIGGGTDLLLMVRAGEVAPKFVLDVRSIPELLRLDYSADAGLTLGAAVSLRTLERSPIVRQRYAQLAQAAAEIGSVQVRTLGTVGGNLCSAMPSADLAPALISLDATARIAGPAGERSLTVEGLIAGPRRTVLGPTEVLVDLAVPPPASRSGGVYLKMANRPTMDITFVGVAAAVTLSPGEPIAEAPIQSARIALASGAPTPIRAREADAVLERHEPDPALLDSCGRAAAAACQPISDFRASADYRREMVAVLTRRAVEIAVARARSLHGEGRTA
jgi:carbon-monoxide dehydrogenase medium subunit